MDARNFAKELVGKGKARFEEASVRLKALAAQVRARFPAKKAAEAPSPPAET